MLLKYQTWKFVNFYKNLDSNCFAKCHQSLLEKAFFVKLKRNSCANSKLAPIFSSKFNSFQIFRPKCPVKLILVGRFSTWCFEVCRWLVNFQKASIWLAPASVILKPFLVGGDWLHGSIRSWDIFSEKKMNITVTYQIFIYIFGFISGLQTPSQAIPKILKFWNLLRSWEVKCTG